MWVFEVMNILTGEVFEIEGVDFFDACEVNDLNPDCLEILGEEPVDW